MVIKCEPLGRGISKRTGSTLWSPYHIHRRSPSIMPVQTYCSLPPVAFSLVLVWYFYLSPVFPVKHLFVWCPTLSIPAQQLVLLPPKDLFHTIYNNLCTHNWMTIDWAPGANFSPWWVKVTGWFTPGAEEESDWKKVMI